MISFGETKRFAEVTTAKIKKEKIEPETYLAQYVNSSLASAKRAGISRCIILELLSHMSMLAFRSSDSFTHLGVFVHASKPNDFVHKKSEWCILQFFKLLRRSGRR